MARSGILSNTATLFFKTVFQSFKQSEKLKHSQSVVPGLHRYRYSQLRRGISKAGHQYNALILFCGFDASAHGHTLFWVTVKFALLEGTVKCSLFVWSLSTVSTRCSEEEKKLLSVSL